MGPQESQVWTVQASKRSATVHRGWVGKELYVDSASTKNLLRSHWLSAREAYTEEHGRREWGKPDTWRQEYRVQVVLLSRGCRNLAEAEDSAQL